MSFATKQNINIKNNWYLGNQELGNRSHNARCGVNLKEKVFFLILLQLRTYHIVNWLRGLTQNSGYERPHKKDEEKERSGFTFALEKTLSLVFDAADWSERKEIGLFRWKCWFSEWRGRKGRSRGPANLEGLRGRGSVWNHETPSPGKSREKPSIGCEKP